MEYAVDEDEFYSTINMFEDDEPYIEDEWKTKIREAVAEKERLQPASSK